MTSRTATALPTHLTNLKPTLDRLYGGVQLSRFGDRSDSDRPAVHAARRSRGRRLLRGGAGLRPRRERAAVDRAPARDHGRRGRPSTFGASIRGAHGPRSRISSTAGRAAPTSSRWSGSCGRCSIAPDRSKVLPGGGLRPGRAGRRRRRSTASRRGRWRSTSAPRYGRVPRRPGVCYFFPRPSAGSALQAAEPVPALDGAPRRARSRRLVAHLAGLARRAARHARDPRRPLPAPDAIHEPRLADGARHHGVAARLDPDDPVKYDFSLCHLGMMNACGFNRAQRDSQCPLRGVCRPRARRRRAVSATIRSTVKRSRTRARPGLAHPRAAIASFASSRTIACAIAA